MGSPTGPSDPPWVRPEVASCCMNERGARVAYATPEKSEWLNLDRRLAVRRGLPVRPMADQLLVRTGELARRQAGGPNPVGSEGHREILGAVARYVPALSGMRLL
jgi:hypothetical protein